MRQSVGPLCTLQDRRGTDESLATVVGTGKKTRDKVAFFACNISTAPYSEPVCRGEHAVHPPLIAFHHVRLRRHSVRPHTYWPQRLPHNQHHAQYCRWSLLLSPLRISPVPVDCVRCVYRLADRVVISHSLYAPWRSPPLTPAPVHCPFRRCAVLCRPLVRQC